MKAKGWKKIDYANINQKKAGMAVLTSDKVDFGAKKITRDRERHYIMMKIIVMIKRIKKT